MYLRPNISGKYCVYGWLFVFQSYILFSISSGLINTHKELKSKGNSTNKQQSSVKCNWKKESSDNEKESESSSRNELSHERQYRNSSTSFTLDRRKDGNSREVSTKTSASNPFPRTGATKTYENNNSYEKNKQTIPLLKPSVGSSKQFTKPMLASVDKDAKNSRIFSKNDKTKEDKVCEISNCETSKTKDMKSLATSKSLLSARLSSLSSSIAAAKSKLNLESSAVSNTGSKKLTRLPSSTSNTSSNIFVKSLSSSSKTKYKISQSSSTSSSYSWSKLQSLGSRTSILSNLNKPSTSSLKWTKPGTSKNQSLLRNKPLNAVRVLVKPSRGSTHVWRSRQSLKLDRRKRKSINLENKGFMKRQEFVDFVAEISVFVKVSDLLLITKAFVVPWFEGLDQLKHFFQGSICELWLIPQLSHRSNSETTSVKCRNTHCFLARQ